jgi:protein-L-isoaspartate O-methyltransferase
LAANALVEVRHVRNPATPGPVPAFAPRSDAQLSSAIAFSLRKCGIENPALFRAIEESMRAEFIGNCATNVYGPNNAHSIAISGSDERITTTPPIFAAFMLDRAVGNGTGKKIIEIGTGSGWPLMVLSGMMRSLVISVDCDEGAFARASSIFSEKSNIKARHQFYPFANGIKDNSSPWWDNPGAGAIVFWAAVDDMELLDQAKSMLDGCHGVVVFASHIDFESMERYPDGLARVSRIVRERITDPSEEETKAKWNALSIGMKERLAARKEGALVEPEFPPRFRETHEIYPNVFFQMEPLRQMQELQ